ncbi:MAG: hypothetical protein DHS20C15_06710 [Planctomycetota bacterium]|nr:MAG: hypothetical protein DHS20C15_06710 [Planctomycetota bacterium]
MRSRAPRYGAALLLAALTLVAPGCASVGDWFAFGPDWVAVDTRTGESVTLEQMADELASADVVFLGELHDSPVGHALQADLLALLGERRPEVVLSLEMFERDVQAELDRYLAGELSEDAFLENARPWPRYASDYRPAVEWAREHGRPVLAANVPRPLAKRVATDGLAAVSNETHVPLFVDHSDGEYRTRFDATMAGHGSIDDGAMARYFAAQCLKDEVMAQSIAASLQRDHRGALVVHLCGNFHSDFGLGTVERLERRAGKFERRIVSMRRGPRDARPLSNQDRASADYLWLVRR